MAGAGAVRGSLRIEVYRHVFIEKIYYLGVFRISEDDT